MFRATQADELNLEAVFNASPNAYVVFDPYLKIVGCNDAYLKAVGRSDRDEIVGRGLFETFPSDPESLSYKLLHGSLQRVVETHEPDHLALIPYSTSQEGEPPQIRYWSATHTPIFDSRGQFRYVLQHTVDVTELQRLLARDAQQIIAGASVLERAREVQAENQAILAESAWFRNLFSQTPGFVAVMAGPRHVFQITNTAYEELVGKSDLVGRAVAEALPEIVDQGFVDLLDQVLKTGEPYVGRGMPALLRHGVGLERRFVDFVFQPLADSEGTVIGIFVQGHDITHQKLAELELARQSEYLRMAQEAGGFGTFEWDLVTGSVNGSEAFRRLYGLDADTQIRAADFASQVHPDDIGRLAISNFANLEEALRPTEYRVVTSTGERWIWRQGIVLYEGGKPTRVLGAVQDITERKLFEERLKTVARESGHRVKNILALVQAVVVQTLRKSDNLQSAKSLVADRLIALAAAHSAMVDGQEEAADIKELVQHAMALHVEVFERVNITGPSATLCARSSLGLGLMLHELTTNAVKYGGLSNEEGSVDIRWSRREREPVIDFVWQERGGPQVTPPKHRGFGSSLIEQGLAHEPRNRVVIDYPHNGLICRAQIIAE